MAVFGADGGGAGRVPLISDDDKPDVGLRALIGLLFVGSVVGLAIWATWGDENQNVNEAVGLIVSVGLAIFLLATAFGPALAEHISAIGGGLRRLGQMFWWVAWPITLLDQVLRRVIAPLTGVTLRQWWLRYPILIMLIAPAIFAGLLHHGDIQLPEHWLEREWLARSAGVVREYAFAILAFAFLVLMAVVRRWFWNEDQFANPNVSHEVSEKLADLRDEALFAILIFFAALPLALSLAPNEWFGVTSAGASCRPATCAPIGAEPLLRWYAFFGAELLKAIPFVDWAEVYNVRPTDGISPRSDYGYHAVFLTRAVVDLVLIGSILHAIQRVSRIRRQEADFYALRVNVVDPFLEHKFIRKMLPSVRITASAAPNWIGNFANYDEGRLRRFSLSPSRYKRTLAYHALVAEERADKEPGYLAERLTGANGIAVETDDDVQDVLLGLLTRPDVGGGGYLAQIARDMSLKASVRTRAVLQLVQISGSTHRAEYMDIAEYGSNREARSAGINRVADMPGDDINDMLRRIAQKDRAGAVRRLAENVLAQRVKSGLASENPTPA